MHTISVSGAEVVFNPEGGLLDRVVFSTGGRSMAPLHRAPWIGVSDDWPEAADLHLTSLAGDFFCAPFGTSDIEPAPFHGWPANGHWTLRQDVTGSDGARTAVFDLGQRILGAALRKELTLRSGHPLLYQRHVFSGGRGALPVAHHAMIRVPGGARLSFSCKDFGATPAGAPEPDPRRGRSLPSYPSRFESLESLPLADGATVDARVYPFATGHEDFLSLFDPPKARFAWTAALARADGFLFFAIKNAGVLGQTSIWLSNGGRNYKPWLSRHTCVLGLEESCAHFGDGHLAAITANELSRNGYPTALHLAPEEETEIRYALGAVPAPDDWTEVEEIVPQNGKPVIRDVGGHELAVPFDSTFPPED